MRYPEILDIDPAPAEFSYDVDFTILYALALGAGRDEGDLSFVYEKGLRALPTMAVLMAGGSEDFITKGEIDFSRIVHGEQRLTIEKPLPPTGRMISRSRCLGVVDKGASTGAIVDIESEISDAETGACHARAVMSLFCRGDGGFDGPTDRALELRPVPEREPDHEVAMQTLPQQAALYRLTGDRNPLHIDPAVAKSVGFDGPIQHGLCTYGMAGRAIIAACCDNDPARMRSLDVRFSAPFFPGEELVIRIWRDGNDIAFECLAKERGAVVIRNGHCRLAD